MEENLNVVDATQENVVDSQTTEPVQATNEPVNAGSGDVTTSQVDTKPVQSAEENAKFAQIRREIEARANADAQKKIDAEYSRLYGEQYGIHTKADYDKAVAEYEEQQRIEAESKRMQASPELLKEIEDLKAFKNEVLTKEQQKAQEEAIQSVANQAKEVLEIAKNEGVELTEEKLIQTALDKHITDLKDAYKLLKPDVDIKTIKENAVKEYIEARKAGKIPVEGSGNTPVVSNEAPKDFKAAKEGALAMLKAAKLFNN